MRPKERIPIFLEKVDWGKLKDRWNLKEPLKYMCRKARTYWYDNPDQRIGQVLINLNLIPDSVDIWMDEDYKILIDQGIPPREILFWGRNYDKDMNLLPKTEFLLIKDMETDHIKAILDGNWCHSSLYKEVFEKELELRKLLPTKL